MNIKSQLFGAISLAVGAIFGANFTSETELREAKSLYIADFQAVDSAAGSPINFSMSPGMTMVTPLSQGSQSEFCMHSQVDDGHWRLVWMDASEGKRPIELG